MANTLLNRVSPSQTEQEEEFQKPQYEAEFPNSEAAHPVTRLANWSARDHAQALIQHGEELATLGRNILSKLGCF